jgi:hypothetical protein
MGLPIAVSPRTQSFYDFMEDLPAGTVIHYAFDVSAGSLEQKYLSTALYTHLAQLDVKVVWTSNVQEGGIMWNQMREKNGDLGKVYGEDFVSLGFIPGFESAVAALAEDMWGATGGYDQYGTSLSSLPLMADIHGAEDFDIMIVTFPGDPFYYLRQWTNKFGIPTYCTSPASLFPLLKPYEGPENQIKNMIVGSGGAAEYDFLLSRPSIALSSMDAQSFGHMFTFAAFLLGNIVFYIYTSGRKN